MLRISQQELNKIINKTFFANYGDSHERQWWFHFKERFPNCEIFWRYFIVPHTNRILPEGEREEERIRPRDGVAEEIRVISNIHYTIFVNMIYSLDHLKNFQSSSFEDFYIHLSSAGDLAEEFLLKTYFLILECRGQKSEILQELKKEDFLKKAQKWYDENYSKIYEDYLKKGKPASIKLPNRKNILDEYFKDSEDWRQYKRFIQKIREYRNIIVHDVQIGKILSAFAKDIVLVPKKEKIKDYKDWQKVFTAGKDIEKLRKDFIEMKEQMILDIGTIQILLNNIWDKPINDLKILFDEKNKVLLRKFDIEIIN